MIKLNRDYPGEMSPVIEGKKRIFSKPFKASVVLELNSNNICKTILAEKLEIGLSTLNKWKRHFKLPEPNNECSKMVEFKKLEIQPIKMESQGSYIEGKFGTRIFGLSLSQMAELLRCL